ncbi:hypothetical protein CBM2585_A130012 [Cupriavidus taiwanensis]|nr:hypothetical protein CBM2585_A130012 [Cupriavidus taiwanensis]
MCAGLRELDFGFKTSITRRAERHATIQHSGDRDRCTIPFCKPRPWAEAYGHHLNQRIISVKGLCAKALGYWLNKMFKYRLIAADAHGAVPK